MADPVREEISAVADAIFRAAFLTALVVVAACVTVRWVLPPVLGLLRRAAQDLIELVAACVVVPEYWISTVNRQRAQDPPLLAYEYGYAVGSVAHVAHAVVGWVFRVAARAASGAHPAVVGAVAGALEISLLAGWS